MALVLGTVTDRMPIKAIPSTHQDMAEDMAAHTAIFKTTEDGVAAAALAVANVVEVGSTAWAISFTEEAVVSTEVVAAFMVEAVAFMAGAEVVEEVMGADNYFGHAMSALNLKVCIMKKPLLIILGITLASALTGCSSVPIVLAPVGPNPAYFRAAIGNGQLEVFSALSGHSEGNNPTWYRHTDYYICNYQGKRLEHVDDAMGHYSRSPRIITLPSGKYIVKARAKGILRTDVPVVIKPGETTEVHLDGNWQPPAITSAMELVNTPAGYPVGWSANTTMDRTN